MSRRFLTATLAATLLVILTASAAMAGEVTGNESQGHDNREQQVGHGAACPIGVRLLGAGGTCSSSWTRRPIPSASKTRSRVCRTTTQSSGQIPKAVRDILEADGHSPGDACNPHGPHRK